MNTQNFAAKFVKRTNGGSRFLWAAVIALLLCPLSTLAQCTISWSGGTSGSWDVAGNWTPSGPPSGSSNTCISTAGSSVTINGGDATGNLTLGSTDSLGFGAGETLTVGGNISNAGTITLNTPSYGIQLIISGTSTLSGAGTINLGNNNGNEIDGSGTLTNQSTIQGGGYIGGGTLTLSNSGTIDANSGYAMEIQTAGTLINTSTIEATAAAGLDIYASTVNNAGGTILASGTNSEVTLYNTSVTGGTLTSSSGGVIYGQGASLNTLTISTGTTFEMLAGQTVYLNGTITNNGNIFLNTASYGDTLNIATNTTLTGGGSVTLSNDSGNVITTGTPGTTLTNVNNTISGVGSIGNGSGLNIVNDASGIIDANVSGGTLTINPYNNTVGTTTNLGTLEASNGGILTVENTVTNTGGTIEALTGSTVNLYADVIGGNLTTTGTGVIDSYGAALDGTSTHPVTITSGSTVQLTAGETMYLEGSIVNDGTIFQNTSSYGTTLEFVANTTLSGGGKVTLSNDGSNVLNTNTVGTTLTNTNNTISGVGNIGNDDGLNIINDSAGIINANVSAGTLFVEPGTQAGISTTNLGLMEASGGGTLYLEDTFTNTGGTVEALAGSTVILGSTDFIGGTLTSVGTGVIYSYNATLDGTSSHPITISSGSTVELTAGYIMYVGGSIINEGTIFQNTSSYGTTLEIVANTTLSGGGKVTLSNDSSNVIDTNTVGTTLTNTNNTISGVGNIGNQSGLNIINQGTIDANVTGGTLTVQPLNGSTGTTTNTGTMEATNGGILHVDDTVTNTGGVILASGTGSEVILYGSTINGGTLTSSSGGAFYAQNTPYLNGVTISSGSSVDIQSGQELILEGTITNKGTINIESTSYGSTLYIDGNVTLTSPGKVILTATGSNFIDGNGGILTNQGTIEGRGNVGNGDISIVNTGTIEANETGANAPSTLIIDTNSNGFTNNSGTKNGTLSVSNKNTLIIEGGPLNNYNSATGELTGGIYKVTGTLEFNAGTLGIVTNDANITLTSATGKILNTNEGDASALSGFNDNASGGTFTVDSTTFTTGGNFTNSGTLGVGSGAKFAVGASGADSLTNFNSGTSTLTGGTYILTGTGQIQFNNGGDASDIVTNDAKITLAGVDTTKSNFIDQTGANALANYNANGSTGSLTLTTDRNFTTGGSFTNAGTVDVQKSTGTGHTQLTITGSYTQTGGTTTVDGLLTTSAGINISGGFVYGNAGTLTGNFDLTGGTLNPGDGVKKAGKLSITGNYTQSGAGILDIDLGGTTAGTNYDVLNISGLATLGGTLDVDAIGTYKPTAGQQYDILNYGSVSGGFSSVDCTFSNGDGCMITYDGTEAILTITAAAPAPRSASLGAVNGTPARWTRSASLLGSGPGVTHEPSAILTPAESCSGLRTFASFACLTKVFSGVTASVGPAARISGVSERASATFGTLHNNVASATSGSGARYGSPQAPDTRTASAASIARLYVCAYLPSEVASTMGCR